MSAHICGRFYNVETVVESVVVLCANVVRVFYVHLFGYGLFPSIFVKTRLSYVSVVGTEV